LLYLALEVHVKHGKFSHLARNRPFLPGFLVVSHQNQVKSQNSASAKCSNGNDHALIAARRTFPPVGPNSHRRMLGYILAVKPAHIGARLVFMGRKFLVRHDEQDDSPQSHRQGHRQNSGQIALPPSGGAKRGVEH
jgi:hypothetical protein